MQASDLSTLNQHVLLASFVFSFLFGAIAQRTHFCTMGAVSDIVNMGDWQRMRQWAMAAGVAMLGFGVLVYLGKVDPSKTLYAGSRVLWLSALVGGLLFGFGMVLASGCGSKTLVRIGGGSLKSVIVFIVMGVAAFATLKGMPAMLRVATVDQVAINSVAASALSMPATGLFGIKIQLAQLLMAAVVGGALLLWAFASKEFRSFDNLLAGLGIGGVLTAMWWASGSLGFIAEHPETLQEAFVATNSGRAEALSFVAPVAYTVDWFMFFSDKSKVITLGIASVFGVIAGSAVMALLGKSFRWEGFGGTEDVANHLVGATLMGIGGVTAMGCTVGQGLSGISTLSTMSFIAVAAIIAGAVLAFKYQMWRLEKMA
ncbi:YeeE/YedE family protein [Variovorax sp. PCZ-1]|uniref:YeeE/YedE family protein n=1 Tax=Variovorax sp. PCZ-1 TaxID=2835533 RepID=UPI001BCC0AA5|nr:YeeE/YedE family protein [Variovorax sp. PCZ-1]MBS7807031.1 YeeE/YedE family protein [Variovorax sp. PCZ-1]